MGEHVILIATLHAHRDAEQALCLALLHYPNECSWTPHLLSIHRHDKSLGSTPAFCAGFPSNTLDIRLSSVIVHPKPSAGGRLITSSMAARFCGR
mmetsp:Transcript_35783/g.93967  ORF Transcript_35783/g.93967 Transcript_35783/m.93967 type:complete len:95 (+) Transcript_35783:512-796(+)